MAPHNHSLGNPNNQKDTFFFFFKLNDKMQSGKSILPRFKEFWSAIGNEQHDFDSQSMANILHKSAKHLDNVRASQDVEAYINHIGQNIHIWSNKAIPLIQSQDPDKQFTSQELSMSLHAFATLGIEPSAEFMDAWITAAIPLIQSKDPDKQFTSQGLANSLWAFATLGIEPPAEFMDAWITAATTQIKEGEFNSQDLAMSLRALAIFDSFHPNHPYKDKFSQLFSAAKKPKITGYTAEQCDQIGHAFLWFGDKNKHQQATAQLKKEDERSGSLENNLKEIFSNAAMPVDEKDCIIAALKHKVDMSVTHNGQQILIEADGPTHFTKRLNRETGKYETGRYNGSTIFQTALIEKYMPEDTILIRVPFDVVTAMRANREKQQEALEAFINAGVRQGKGEHTPDNPQNVSRAMVINLSDRRMVRSIREDVWHLDVPMAA